MEKVVTRNFGQPNSHLLETYLKNKGYEAARKALTQMTPAQIIDARRPLILQGEQVSAWGLTQPNFNVPLFPTEL